eukprot:gnl/TRDRNA2_/TRDRNA2_92937_c0_seq1.p1 gnl/TRDRNA2_/TRDRNA2_92937_c0~~gnl/TRDRNA2_/TRDRNA2_92937_c0_seq1.p1  ORF type:complete len:256 (-),score=37.39 gnl/TRDRNA2_/TRDRNA2_92937_c0_seq1:318-1085(-)
MGFVWGEWIGGVGAAISIKLSSSIDDVVWLAPFLTANSSLTRRLTNSVVYISVCLIQTVVAMLIAYSGKSAVKFLTAGNKHAWTPDKILTVGAGTMMAIYSVKLSYEYIMEWREGGGEKEEDKGGGTYNKVASSDAEAGGAEAGQGGPDRPLTEQKPEEESEGKGGGTQTLFVIAFIGSVDDLTLFVPMLVGKGFGLLQLIIGGFIAASAIVLLCVFLGLCQPIADCLSKIPLALIVIIFATVLLIKGFGFSEEG